MPARRKSALAEMARQQCRSAAGLAANACSLTLTPNFQPNEEPEMESKAQAGVLIHAPTAAAVVRARNNAANLLAAESQALVRILVNAEGVAAVLDTPREDTDPLTLVCAKTLDRIGRSASAPLQVIPASIVALAQMQRDGWIYIRA
jgi:uncharacterized protein